jgi:hypothetical protein
MINPSASGWIDKYFAPGVVPVKINNSHEFYTLVRNSGFIYGYVTSSGNLTKTETRGWTAEEITKAALLTVLYDLYRLVTKQDDTVAFITTAIRFYREMTPEGFNPLRKVLPAAAPSHVLENILDERIRTNENIISRNFSHILTNALLFMDVLAFRQYLRSGEIPDKYLKKLEETVVSLVSLALEAKNKKTGYDDLLIKLFESSVRYTKISRVKAAALDNLELEHFTTGLEKNYLLDMAGMAIWSDGMADKSELDFLYSLANQLDINEDMAAESIASFDVFIKVNKKNIPFFKYSNPVKHFYDHAAQTVMLLIHRNKNRLARELSNNGELMVLLTHSTHRTLNAKEKKKIKKQLLEICKTVPSLTIFLLPGGSLLLPLLIKFIPQLLPSVFNENLDRE